MDDIKCSSEIFEEHIEEMILIMKRASESGFEFKMPKGQFNQPEIVL